MVKRMLIEATHPEETRVVVLDGTRLEEFDVETSTKKKIKGNIYLAKVVRVEPSLQAAFVDYGGNRHGFLAFSEIHPDYYQIPIADRERLMAEAQRAEEEEERRDAARDKRREAQSGQGQNDDHQHDHAHDQGHDHAHDQGAVHDGAPLSSEQPGSDSHQSSDAGSDDHDSGDAIPLAYIPPAITSAFSDTESSNDDADDNSRGGETAERELAAEGSEITQDAGAAFPGEPATDPDAATLEPAPGDNSGEPPIAGEQNGADAQSETKPADKAAGVETVGGEEEEEAAQDKQRRRFVASRHYKIQEVIKRRQIMLIQVVKEERGSKGAALTTFLSLAGRYCVLMPNSPRGGGVSRKITSAQDRRRLKSILSDLELPKAMAVILRTAGADRNKAEIKRDYEYLQRTWNNIREVTMTSRAPAPIHEEASLIKRAIRDIYSRDIDEVWVEGEEGYKIGKDFMKMLTPSHAKKVQRYKDDIIPLFHRYQVESQMEAINSPAVQLRSGGSIVFAQTEALVAIDVNSGRATKERHIEETAYKTNMEAAEEIARQLRLRDLAGLIVIDFIDMEDNRNNHAVERRLKEALKADRARIQVGRISHFGLLELSRQRLRPSLIEANFRPCAHCAGSGMVRSTESAAVYSLRMLEEEGGRQRSSEVTMTVHPDVALYLLNYKRVSFASIESRYRLKVLVLGDPTLVPPNIRLDRVKAVRSDESVEAVHREPPPREIERERPDPAEAEADEGEEAANDAAASRAPEPRHHEARHQESRQSEPRGGEPGRAPGGVDEGGRKRRRRRRGGALRHGESAPTGSGQFSESPQGVDQTQMSQMPQGQEGSAAAERGEQGEANQAPGRDDPAKRGRRRGRRGGRRRRRGGELGAESGGRQGGSQNGTALSTPTGESSAHSHDPSPSSSPEAAPRGEADPAVHVAAPIHAPEPERGPAGISPADPAIGGSGGSADGQGDKAPSRFFRALREGTKSWRRHDPAEADTGAPSSPPPVAPVAIPTESREAEPAGPSRRGWWKQDPSE
ncbi:MAG: ribonuclease E/G [Rhodospirillaceae bacterium]|nr:ribonuclease E/G [Rhodospirillaceae bacterium]